MSGRTKIYVALLDEDVDVWRPVSAEHVAGKVYRITDKSHDPLLESWQFRPGDAVVCDLIEVQGERVLAAVRLADGTVTEP